MIDGPTFARIRQQVENLPETPAGIAEWRWCLVAAALPDGAVMRAVNEVEMDLAVDTGLVSAGGAPVMSRERLHLTIRLKNATQLRGLPYVRGIRFGWNEDAKIVIWSVV